MKKALIAGITGQDSSYLAELRLKKGYGVHRIIRRASTFNTERMDQPQLPKLLFALRVSWLLSQQVSDSAPVKTRFRCQLEALQFFKLSI